MTHAQAKTLLPSFHISAANKEKTTDQHLAIFNNVNTILVFPSFFLELYLYMLQTSCTSVWVSVKFLHPINLSACLPSGVPAFMWQNLMFSQSSYTFMTPVCLGQRLWELIWQKSLISDFGARLWKIFYCSESVLWILLVFLRPPSSSSILKSKWISYP